MIEMPVRVDDGGDRLALGLRERQDRVAVPNVAAGIDDSEPIAALENHGVAVRPASRQDRARYERHPRCDFARRRRARAVIGSERERRSAEAAASHRCCPANHGKRGGFDQRAGSRDGRATALAGFPGGAGPGIDESRWAQGTSFRRRKVGSDADGSRFYLVRLRRPGGFGPLRRHGLRPRPDPRNVLGHRLHRRRGGRRYSSPSLWPRSWSALRPCRASWPSWRPGWRFSWSFSL